jgi:hypothetical protein
MGHPRPTGLIVGLLVCLPVVLAGAFPAVASQLAGAFQLRQHDSASVARTSQLQRGGKVLVIGAAQAPLRPGTSAPVALRLANPNSHAVQMNRVRVLVTRVVAPRADAAHPCTPADFTVQQMPRLTLRLPARSSTDLAALGVPEESWPWLTMLNRPVNQDGCQDAELTLTFKARGLHQ